MAAQNEEPRKHSYMIAFISDAQQRIAPEETLRAQHAEVTAAGAKATALV
jgi:hypothetical protein